MTADDIEALVSALLFAELGSTNAHDKKMCRGAATALATIQAQVETLTLENQRLRVDAEAMRQELKNIANADTVEWDDPTQYEAWAKSRARHTLAQIDKEKP